MPGDISGAANIYIITGYTDMRKSIDGLCAIVMAQLKEEPDGYSTIFSAVNAVTVSRFYYASLMDMSFYIKGLMWSMVNTAGQGTAQR